MACEPYEKLQREYKIAADEWDIWAYPQNAHLSGGTPKAQRARLMKAAEEKKKSLSAQMYEHRQSCPACKVTGGTGPATVKRGVKFGAQAKMPTYIEVVTLHRYYIWANKLRTEFDKMFGAGHHPVDPDPLLWFTGEAGLFMSYWYAALYVVIEGWKQLGFKDAEIDALLASSNVAHLKRYRNGVCHFQPEYLDQRFQEIMSSRDSVQWVRTLNRAFGRFFLQAAKPTT